MTSLAGILLAAGSGTRMKSYKPKVLHAIAGYPMISYSLNKIQACSPDAAVVVIGQNMQEVADAVVPYPTVIQTHPKGTADAVRQGLKALTKDYDSILILYGDTPLLHVETLKRMLAVRSQSVSPKCVVLGVHFQNPYGYGRILLNHQGFVQQIIEQKHLSEQQTHITLCYAGVMVCDGKNLAYWIDQISQNPLSGESYLTDLIALLHSHGERCCVVEGTPEEAFGVNTRQQLADVEHIFQQRMRYTAQESGITLLAPETVYFSYDTLLAPEVTIHPYVVFGRQVHVRENVNILSFCYLEDVTIDSAATVGPFVRVRAKTKIGHAVCVGNFVELKNAHLAADVKVNHLSYLGDCTVEEAVNIGAGTITCNFDGVHKHSTLIKTQAFIGSHTALIAPVTIGEKALIGAGSIITHDVEPHALALSRTPQKTYPQAAQKIMHAKKKPKTC